MYVYMYIGELQICQRDLASSQAGLLLNVFSQYQFLLLFLQGTLAIGASESRDLFAPITNPPRKNKIEFMLEQARLLSIEAITH